MRLSVLGLLGAALSVGAACESTTRTTEGARLDGPPARAREAPRASDPTVADELRRLAVKTDSLRTLVAEFRDDAGGQRMEYRVDAAVGGRATFVSPEATVETYVRPVDGTMSFVLAEPGRPPRGVTVELGRVLDGLRDAIAAFRPPNDDPEAAPPRARSLRLAFTFEPGSRRPDGVPTGGIEVRLGGVKGPTLGWLEDFLRLGAPVHASVDVLRFHLCDGLDVDVSREHGFISRIAGRTTQMVLTQLRIDEPISDADLRVPQMAEDPDLTEWYRQRNLSVQGLLCRSEILAELLSGASDPAAARARTIGALRAAHAYCVREAAAADLRDLRQRFEALADRLRAELAAAPADARRETKRAALEVVAAQRAELAKHLAGLRASCERLFMAPEPAFLESLKLDPAEAIQLDRDALARAFSEEVADPLSAEFESAMAEAVGRD